MRGGLRLRAHRSYTEDKRGNGERNSPHHWAALQPQMVAFRLASHRIFSSWTQVQLMSALGQKRACAMQLAMSAKCQKQTCLAHSITWSARVSSWVGTVRLRAFAVLRLMARSNLVGCWT